jgi:UDP-2-acetamido-3-amino-2,3-dideoxy-glucuronate N-acetyltransferase
MVHPIFIHPTSIVEPDVEIGGGAHIWHFCHIDKGAILGENCSLGQNVYIGKGVHIGNNCKIQNNVSVYTGVTIGNDVFIGPSAVFTNVKRPDAIKTGLFIETIVEDGVSIGANATILPGITIGAGAFIGAGSVVTKDVFNDNTVVGCPARPIWR